MTFRRVALAGLVLFVISGFVANRWSVKRYRASPPVGSAPSRLGLQQTSKFSSQHASLPSLPASLIGTVEDGGLFVSDEGGFVPSPDAIDLFDYYLAAVGEESREQIRIRIIAAIRRQLDGAAAKAAVQLLDDYLHYRDRAAELLSMGLIGENLDRRLQYVRELRREIFGADVAQALFGDEEEAWFAVLERRRILLDSSVSDEDRSRRLLALESERPAEEVAARERANAHTRFRSQEALLLGQGARPEEIRQLRVERFGEAAAQRLDVLDGDRALWQRRLSDYRIERDAMLASTPAKEHASALGQLRARHFAGSDAELLRIRAIDGMEESTGF